MGEIRRFEVEAFEVDDVDIGLVTRLQHAAVKHAVELRGALRLRVDDELQRQLLPA